MNDETATVRKGDHPDTPPTIDAVLLDMDGVVTHTAAAHAAVWKHLFDEFLARRAHRSGDAFRAFDPDADYRAYVDGKPRYDGVADFLASRGIALPHGSQDDPADEETVCGLGNRKNRYFHAWLEENRVEAFAGTLAFIDALKRAAIKVAVFSSSRNAEAVLRSADVLDRFDAKVDGGDVAALGLPGKPDPAILHETASRLGVAPKDCAVVEDSIAGVEAGARGGFGLVIGVDRVAKGERLAEAGAHVVVGDLAEIAVRDRGRLTVKTLNGVPSAKTCEATILGRVADKRLAVFLDYDGTLTPIVDDPKAADLDEDMRRALVDLARRLPVAIVSGRGLEDLRNRVGLDAVFLAGSHGFEIQGPEGRRQTLEKGIEFLPDLDGAERSLHDQLDSIEGAEVERKRFSIAVHYRRVASADVKRVEDSVDRVLARQPRLHKGEGKKVFQLQPSIDWNKGRALEWILDRLDLDREDVVPLYIGDDVTDEDAFRVLSGRGIGIVVRDADDRPTAADYALESPAEVADFIRDLSACNDEDAA